MKLDLSDEVIHRCAERACLLEDNFLTTMPEFRRFFDLLMWELHLLAWDLAHRDPPEPAEL